MGKVALVMLAMAVFLVCAAQSYNGHGGEAAMDGLAILAIAGICGCTGIAAALIWADRRNRKE